MAKISRKDNPEGHMPLGDHLREARNRLFLSVGFFILASIAGAFFFNDVLAAIQEPLKLYAKDKGALNFNTILGNFEFVLQVSLALGLVFSSPFWLYQIWAYIQPGLTKKEKKNSLLVFFAAAPLFLAGVYLAWLVYPHAIKAMFAFTPEGATNLLSATEFLQFFLRLHLAFGFAFLLPVLLVGANVLNMVTGKQVAKAWRVVVFLCVAFAAIAAPGPDLFPMFALAAPMLILFVVAVLICMVNDKARAKKALKAPRPNEVRSLDQIA